MLQGLYAQPGDAIAAFVASGLAISTCNIQSRTNVVDALGELDLTNWVDVAGLTGIKCMFSVETPLRPDQNDVGRTMQQSNTHNEFHVLLVGYYPGILQQYTAVIDGFRYQIQTSESDSQKTMTRLAVRTYTL